MTGHTGSTRYLQLTITEFEVAWEALRLGPTPLVLDLPSPGHDHDERRHIVAEATASLTARGLHDRRGPRGDLIDALSPFAQHVWAIHARFWYEQPLRALAVSTSRFAALAIREADVVHIAAPAERDLVPELLTLTGYDVPAGPGQPWSVPAALFDNAVAACANDPTQFVSELIDRGQHLNTARFLTQLAETTTTQAQFALTTTIPRLPNPPDLIAHTDTPQGRYLHLRRTTPKGTHLTITPGTTQDLHTHLNNLIATTLANH